MTKPRLDQEDPKWPAKNKKENASSRNQQKRENEKIEHLTAYLSISTSRELSLTLISVDGWGGGVCRTVSVCPCWTLLPLASRSCCFPVKPHPDSSPLLCVRPSHINTYYCINRRHNSFVLLHVNDRKLRTKGTDVLSGCVYVYTNHFLHGSFGSVQSLCFKSPLNTWSWDRHAVVFVVFGHVGRFLAAVLVTFFSWGGGNNECLHSWLTKVAGRCCGAAKEYLILDCWPERAKLNLQRLRDLN